MHVCSLRTGVSGQGLLSVMIHALQAMRVAKSALPVREIALADALFFQLVAEVGLEVPHLAMP
jgi:hypothetical protein